MYKSLILCRGLRRSSSRTALNLRFLSTEVPPNAYGPNLRNDILEASLRNVHMLGWTQETIVKAVLDLGLPPLTHRVLGRGPVELVEFFIDKKRAFAKERVADLRAQWNNKTPSTPTDSSSATQTASSSGESGAVHETQPNAHEEHHGNGQSGPDVDTILQVAIEAHIDYIYPYAHTWPSALATFADPSQASYAVTTAMQLADDIVSMSDIQASRGDWYTERLLATMLYSSTELFMLTDTSENLQDTKDFLKRNIQMYQALRGVPGTGSRVKDALFRYVMDKK
eukprot:gene9200-10854_t